MQDLGILFTNLFLDKEISNNRLVICGRDHLLRLTKNNPGGVYDGLIADTNTAVTNLNNNIVARGSDADTRSGSTTGKNTARADLTQYIRREEGLVKSVFAKGSGKYKEIFPRGLTVFHNCSKAVYDTYTKVVLEKAIKYESDLGTAFKTGMEELYGLWNSAYKKQGTDRVVADNAGTTEQAAELVLELQLTKNALVIASNNVGNDAAFQTYFDTQLLFAQHRTHIYKGVAAANATSMVHAIEYSAGKRLRIKNKGAVALSFQMWLGNTPVGNSYTVEPGGKIDKSFADFFGLGDSLHVTNESATTEGIFQVRQVA